MTAPTRSSSTLGKRSIVARIAALLALIACGVAIYLVVMAFTEDDGGDKGDEKKNRSRQNAEVPAGYTVVAGDTLSAIATETGVPEQRLERLNPDLDPESLNAGQVLVLRSGG